jgi:predicted GNAT family N-acyltransferase
MPESHLVIFLADWEEDKTTLRKIRSQVFIKEQNVPEDMEWDEFDSNASHFLALENNQAIACARLKSDGQIGRMAVLPEYRNKGTGKKLLQFVLQEAAAQNLATVYLHAQLSALDFYEKQGFSARGDVFYEANIPHREMLKKIC